MSSLQCGGKYCSLYNLFIGDSISDISDFIYSFGRRNKTLMLYAGFNDKYGNEVYQNDILIDNEFLKIKVEFGMQCVDAFVGVGFNIWSTYDVENGKYEPNLNRIKREHAIIGNIYETPELLKGCWNVN